MEVSSDGEIKGEESEKFRIGYFLNGKVPKGYMVGVYIEKYKNGKPEPFLMNMLSEVKFNNRHITFGVSMDDSDKTVVRLGSSDFD